jgi:electron transfer flavoprotein alpha subunit
VLVRPASVVAEEASAAGSVESVDVGEVTQLPAVQVVDSVAEAGAAASIEEARIIVGGGRGVGSPEGFRQVEELADALGGAVGATRAVVDSGWIGYSQQIGQTGKIVKPALYVACGISGAIQHKVGVQTAGTIVAINKDSDAPIAEFADLFVVGDMFEIVPRLTEAVRARKSGGG